MSTKTKTPSMIDALIPILFLIVMLALSVYIYGSDSSYGGNQIALILAACLAAIIGIKNGYKWKEIEKGIIQGISLGMGAILILLAVGALIGTWIMSGTVPTMIYYGLNILSPSIFYFAACLICAVSALSIGSSWTVAGTLGVALMGIAAGLGLSPAVTAGAVISGAYFGDKMSPLSDTTNLAPSVAGTDLFTHIRHMIWTTGPSLVIALILFLIMGFQGSITEDVGGLSLIQDTIEKTFNISLLSFIPLLTVFILAFKKMPAFPTVMIGALLGGIFAVILQPQVVANYANRPDLSSGLTMLSGVWTALHSGFALESGVTVVDELLTRGGMISMLNTIWLVICALTYGAVLETTGLLNKVVESLLSFVNSTGSLIVTTIATCIGINIITADQYIAIVLPGRMFRAEFARRNLAPKNLSRTLEDAGTITSPLVPWNTCGAYMSASLGVATFAYLPFCFFNLINPVVAIIYGLFNIKIEKLNESELPLERV
ncbi:MAG: Na+/H+ antiporter NhaC [Candidatus Marinimicrobia bacterium]|jgi:NhaC family Na+:H+ antiporter|nr:Na+/H+ antiporter NhaC [Candidatus Neomarinimicrobiota bacterium]MBT3676545.1 Na+/H+ antiporter NhaC [Candidatus Neomarinimicrobiota bacterium]MBT3763048.1 Na+/H+ antiporter NhaC [Candidatus Neomarinimicrobiota bacterium]MBT4067988.1 Na+/H+ antiporter NhaC [Candidatus Neomarinimicrobiota bacterium]MBT4271151.1 Na+/H+ antiporter NhaC [Candidatus Neomarinimicrobiota bacterium]